MSERSALVLIPGLLCTNRLWRDQVADLDAVAECTVTTAQCEHDNLADITAAILAEAPDRFSVAGLSFGGYVCFEILRQAPERVERLALMNTRAAADDERRRNLRADQIRLVDRGRFLGVSDQMVKTFIHPDRLADEDLVADVKAMARSVGKDGFIRQQTAIIGRPDSQPLLPGIQCPTLVVAGRQDGLIPFAEQAQMAAAIPGARLLAVENCGHLSSMERPAEVTQAMRRWLAMQ